jgi:hypothetical protein
MYFDFIIFILTVQGKPATLRGRPLHALNAGAFAVVVTRDPWCVDAAHILDGLTFDFRAGNVKSRARWKPTLLGPPCSPTTMAQSDERVSFSIYIPFFLFFFLQFVYIYHFFQVCSSCRCRRCV